MKKLLTSSIIGGLLLPTLAFAAYDDVTLGSSAKIVAGGHTLDVVGDSNTIETIIVDVDSFTITLQANSTLKVSSPNFKEISHTALAANISTSACESNDSHVKFTASAAVTITVTPKSIVCGAASGSGSSGSVGGGGGGGASVSTVVTPVAIPTNPTIAQLQAQLNALLAQLNALQSGASVAPGLINAGKVHITQILSKGSRGNSIKGLQQFLNNHGFIISSSGAGSPGQETDYYGTLTEKAVGKFQEKYNIAKPGDSGYGRVGPKTRAKINEISDQ
ncbi:MAG: peptidoglycan-binding domain-containing protein [Patescibacteria group bacterium]